MTCTPGWTARPPPSCVTTFIERWQAVAGDHPGAVSARRARRPADRRPTSSRSRARTTGRCAGSVRGLPFAPTGESTILDTLTAAIGQARRYIYIEDQYLTPPPAFADALVAAAAHVSGPLIIVVPSSPDQPFGLPRRQALINDCAAAWGDRVRVGILRRRFSHTPTSRESSARPAVAAPRSSPRATTWSRSRPPERVPTTPFWLTVDGEVMRATRQVAGFSSPASVRLDVERWEDTRLFDATSGTVRAGHNKDAAVSLRHVPVDLRARQDAADRRRVRRHRLGQRQPARLLLRRRVQRLLDARAGDRAATTGSATCAWPCGPSTWVWRRSTPPSRSATPPWAWRCSTGSSPLAAGSPPSTPSPTRRTSTLSAEFNETDLDAERLLFIAEYIAALGTAIAGAESDGLFDTFVDPSSWLEGP